MSGMEYLKFLENNSSFPVLSSNIGIPGADSVSSLGSCLSGTLKEGDSLLSCSESELSIRTGSVAFQPLPPRPAPPPPPPLQKQPPRRTSGNTSTSSSGVTTKSGLTVIPKKCKYPLRSKSAKGKTQSLKKPRLSRTLSSDTFTKPKLKTFPVEQMSRTFSSEGLRGILYSLPPSYPPPLPPDTPLLQPAPRYTQTPPVTPPVPPKPQRLLRPPIPPKPQQLESPPLPLPPRTERRASRELNCNNARLSSNSSLDSSSTNHRPFNLKRRSLIFLTFFSVALSFICCCFTTYTFLFHFYEQRLLQICIPLRNFESNFSIATYSRLLQKLPINEKQERCATTSDQVSILIQAMFDVSRNVSGQIPGQRSQLNSVSAHVYLRGSEHRNDDVSCGPHRLNLKKMDNFREHFSYVQVNQNFLCIERPGLYFVYSSIYFKPQRSGTACKDVKELEHFIIRARRQNTETLAQSSHTCPVTCDGERHTHYTGGLFELRKDDEIFVNVTNQGLISTEGHASYLGLVMVKSNCWKNSDESVSCSAPT